MDNKNHTYLEKTLQSMQVKARFAFYRKVRLQLFWKYMTTSFSRIFISLPFFTMKKTVTAVIAIVFVAIAALGIGYYSFSKPSYLIHIESAEKKLAQIEQIISGQEKQIAFIPHAYADEEGEKLTDEEEQNVSTLTQEVVAETNSAIVAVKQDVTDQEKIMAALERIKKLTYNVEEVLAKALEIVEKSEDSIVKALENIVLAKELVEQEKSKIQVQENDNANVASLTGSGSITGTGSIIEEKAEKRLEEAKVLMEQLQELNIDTTKLQVKMDKADEAYLEGKSGRVYGLSTAVTVKAKAELRKASKEEDKNVLMNNERNQKRKVKGE